MKPWNGTTQDRRGFRRLAKIEQLVLLVPEGPVLLALLLIGWAFAFPPLIGVLVGLTVAVFLLRLFLLSCATRQLEHAHYRRAEWLAQAALWLYPWSADALALRAQSMLLRGDDARADPLLRRAARLAPTNDHIHGALAGSLLARGKFAAGRAHATRADRLVAGSPHAARHLAWLALKVDGDPIAAQRILGQVDLAYLPPELAAGMLLMQAEAQLARRTFNAAAATARRVEELLPACPVPQQAEFLYHLGKLYDALDGDGGQYFRRSVDLDPHGRYARAAWRAAMELDSPPRPLAAS